MRFYSSFQDSWKKAWIDTPDFAVHEAFRQNLVTLKICTFLVEPAGQVRVLKDDCGLSPSQKAPLI